MKIATKKQITTKERENNMCASPQLENGYCSFATELIEQFCKYRLSGEEWLVLWAIFRKTYCWHKKEDKIALSTFAVMTGLKRPTARRALIKLESKKIIDIIKNDYRTPNLYRFNKHFDTWASLSKKITLESKKIMTVIKKDNELESKKIPSIDIKDTYSKDSIYSDFAKSDTPDLNIPIGQWNDLGWLELPDSPRNTTIHKQGWLPRCRGATESIRTSWNKIKPSPENWLLAIENYLKELAERDPTHGYAEHRFSLYEFITQKNGYKKYLNR